MTICEYCIKNIFTEPVWKSNHGGASQKKGSLIKITLGPREKKHHTDAATWQESTKDCTICRCLLTAVQDAIMKKMEATISNMLDTYTRFEPVLNVGVLGILKDVLPIYKIIQQESSATEQYVLIFRPIEENARRIDVSGPFGRLEGLTLPERKFQVYSTDYDDDKRSYAEIPRLSNETGIDCQKNGRNRRTFDQIQTWMDECNGDHKYCKHFAKERKEGSFVPTRLIEIGGIGQQSVRIVVTKGAAEYNCYATLSHCWGGFVTVQTYTSNYVEHITSGIKIGPNFPQNFLDAINVCRALGIKYIWIDSMCIVQGPGGDFLEQAPLMHQVYGCSFLNIAATSARNSTEGLFRHRRINLLEPSTVKCGWKGLKRNCRVIRKDFWSGELLAEPLYKRAWVSQERMLSPRTINFGTKQLFWQCLTITACESMPQGIPEVVDSSGREELEWRQLLQQVRDGRSVDLSDRVNMQDAWRDAVRNYTSCNITNTEDKLPAVAGLAQEMYKVFREDYIAGMWGESTSLVVQMAWKVKDCQNIEGKPARRQRADEYRAPTWAWPSVVDGIVEIPRRVRMDRSKDTYVLQLLGKPHLVLQNPEQEGAKFMRLKDGWVDARGIVLNWQFVNLRDPETPCWILNAQSEQDAKKPWVYLYPDEPLDNPSAANLGPASIGTDSRDKCDFPLLLLYYVRDDTHHYTGRALVLRERFSKEMQAREKPVFSRIGLVEFYQIPGILWDQLKNRLYDTREPTEGGNHGVMMTDICLV